MKSTKTWHVPALAVLAITLSSLVWAGEAASAPNADIIARSVVSMGNTARLQRVFAKARRGEKVTVGVLGGSITQGALASSEENRYGNRIAQWWRDTFPKAEIAFVNAGIGATGSDSGAYRVREHLLSKQPDFVVVEYAVNDPNLPAYAETLEGVVRQILKERNHPAVMLLFMMNEAGVNAQEQHAPIGAHYGLPMVSFRDALWPEIEAKRMAWSDVEADGVHPNDRGHEYAARFVTHVLQQALETLPKTGRLPRMARLPKPLTKDAFERTAMYNANTLTPTENKGWEVCEKSGFEQFFGPCWTSNQPGSTIEFKTKGTAFSVLFYRVKGASGIAEACVDGGAPVRMDAWFDATWGGYTPFQLVARDLKPGKHRVRVTLLEDKNPGSTGYEFRIHAILTARPRR